MNKILLGIISTIALTNFIGCGEGLSSKSAAELDQLASSHEAEIAASAQKAAEAEQMVMGLEETLTQAEATLPNISVGSGLMDMLKLEKNLSSQVSGATGKIKDVRVKLEDIKLQLEAYAVQIDPNDPKLAQFSGRIQNMLGKIEAFDSKLVGLKEKILAQIDNLSSKLDSTISKISGIGGGSIWGAILGNLVSNQVVKLKNKLIDKLKAKVTETLG